MLFLSFKGVTRERLGKIGYNGQFKKMELILKFYTQKTFKLGKGRLKNFDWKESTEIEDK